MSLSVFLEVVEIRTKVASVFPFIMGVLFSLVYFHEFHPLNTVIFFLGMLLFDLTTTSINNYMDFKKAKSETYKYQHNVIGRENISEATVRNLIFAVADALIGGQPVPISSGGGGSTSALPWDGRRPDEEEEAYRRRCLLHASQIVKAIRSGYRRR